MKRDWDLIREVLIELEALDTHNDRKDYEIERGKPRDTDAMAEQALLLFKSRFIEGIDANTFDGPAVIARGLTWEGHDLLQTIRSKPVWERVKKIAEEKGIELTFDAVKQLAAKALAVIIAS
jgi:hypothetical protein